MPSLSKSDYTKFRECSCLLWLHKLRPDLMPEDDEAQKRMDQGNEIDALARQLYPGGVEIQGFHKAGFENAKKAAAKGVKIMFQPTAVTEDLNAKADVLVRDDKNDCWDLHEIKAANSVKDEYPYDVAFQRIVFEGAGFKIGRIFLVHLNRDYVRKGALDPKKLFVSEDITKLADMVAKVVEEEIPQAKAALGWQKEPGETHVMACSDPAKCEHIGYWLKELPPKRLSELLALLPPKTVSMMIEKEIVSSPQLTEKFLKTISWRSPSERWPKSVDAEGLADMIGAYEYPLHFLDYETYGPAIPPFDGCSPYKQMPFQFSALVIPKKGAKAVRYDFLKADYSDPIPELLAALRKAIGDKGTVLSWNMSFEKGCNDWMAARQPKYASFLGSINRRTLDLGHVFSKKLFQMPEFGGRWSLKAILPVLVPHLAYDDLEIQGGMTASNSWPIVTDPNAPPDARKKLYQDMIDYCHRDTDGMVKILEHLHKVTK